MDAEQLARLAGAHAVAGADAAPQPDVDHAATTRAMQLDAGSPSQPAIAARRAGIAPGSGRRKPAIISRNSCRAATWPRPTSPIAAVEQGQALGEQLAIDDALAKARE